MGWVSGFTLYHFPDNELKRWVYLPSRDELHSWPIDEATHYQKLYDFGFDRNKDWSGGLIHLPTGDVSKGAGTIDPPPGFEDRLRSEILQDKTAQDASGGQVDTTTTDTTTPSMGGLMYLPDQHLFKLVEMSTGWIQSSHPHKRYMRRKIVEEVHRRTNYHRSTFDDSSCPECRHLLEYDDGGYGYCPNCGWFPSTDEIPGEGFNAEEYLHERDFHNYINDYSFPAYLQHTKTARIWNIQQINNAGFGGTTGIVGSGRPWLTDGENLWVGNNSSGHEALIYAINNPEQQQLALRAYDSHMIGTRDINSAASGYFRDGKVSGIIGNHAYASEAESILRSLYGTQEDPKPPLVATAKIETLPDEFKPHAHDIDSRRSFVYLVPNDTLYIAQNNAYHNDIMMWMYNNKIPAYLEAANGSHDSMALGFIERSHEDHALDARMYYAEGLERLPGHIMHELEQYFGEPVYQSDWQYPVDWRYVDDIPYEDSLESTQQWPTDAFDSVIGSFLKIAADVRELAAQAYNKIMERPDVAKIYDLAQLWEDKYQSERPEGQPAHNFGKMMVWKQGMSPEQQEVVRAHNAHVLAYQIQNAISNMRNNYPAAYKLMPNAVKTLKTWANEAENQNGDGMNVQWDRNPGTHVGDIYGGAGELLQRLRAENRVPQGMDVNQMSFSDLQDWLYSFHESEPGSQYRTNNVVYDIGNGWKIVRITDDQDLAKEGELMGHCVGTYCNRVHLGTSLIYSLRDPKNEPHATIEIEGQLHTPPLAPHDTPYDEDTSTVPPEDWQVAQIQGKGNAKPIPEYEAMIKQWFEHLQDDEGVHFAPQDNHDFIEYVEDTEELMDWYDEHGSKPEPPQQEEGTPLRDEYGLPLQEDSHENGFQFEWTTLLSMCLDSLAHSDSRKYRYQGVYSPSELATAFTAAANRYHLTAEYRKTLVEYAERELLDEEQNFDDHNFDYFSESALAAWKYEHPDEEPDYESDEWQQLEGEIRDEAYKEYFGDMWKFIQLLATQLTGQGAFGAQPQSKVIYV